MSNQKAMSSRLLTMKFMQRAATSTPSRDLPTTPSASLSPLEPASKRQRLANGTSSNRRSTTSDLEAVRAALAEEDMRNRQALDRRAAELGEERWVLDVANLGPFAPQKAHIEVETASAADMEALGDDSDNSDGESEGLIKTYGPKRKSKGEPGTSETSESYDHEGESEAEYDPSGLDDLIDEGKRAAAVKGNLTSRPNSDPITFKTISGSKSVKLPTCFACKQVGHKVSECPNVSSSKRRR